ARGEDNPDSDVDVLYKFQEGRGGLYEYADVTEYLENLFSRNIDFVSIKWMSERLKKYVEPDMILFGYQSGASV
ncbi:MAG: hypothetical protein Q4Q53_09010, partial [Methanocorpusculum sp.]|nr:hypothetical protein [Methanocorpusculum sp.]